MKKISLFILFVYFCCPTVLFSATSKTTPQVKTDDFSVNYRFDPFQWIYPEYYYKADIVPVTKEKAPIKGYSKIDFFGLSAYVPERYTSEITSEHDIMTFLAKNGDRILMIKATNDSFVCSDKKRMEQKDFCTAYKTPQELFHKLFTLTPDTAENMGDKWIVHDKGLEFDNVKKIAVFSDDKFMAYVKYIKGELIEKTEYSHEITLFHVNGPMNSYVNIRFTANDDIILNHFISTLE